MLDLIYLACLSLLQVAHFYSCIFLKAIHRKPFQIPGFFPGHYVPGNVTTDGRRFDDAIPAGPDGQDIAIYR